MKERLTYIDILKGISIVSIVLLHIEAGVIPPGLNTWIGSFMITAFYLVSGWLMAMSDKEYTVKEHFLKRLPTLVKPYLWFSIILIGFDLLLVLLGFKDLQIIGIDIYKTLTLRGIGTLWFLPALLVGELLFVYSKRKRPEVKVLFLVLVSGYFLAYHYWSENYAYSSELFRIIDAPFRTLQNAVLAYIVIFGGYFIYKKYHVILGKINPSKLGLLTVVVICLSYALTLFLPRVLPPMIIAVISPFTNQILCPLGILLFAKLTDRFIIHRFFIFWGKNSLALMATHYSILMEVCLLMDKFYFNFSEPIGWRMMAYFLLIMVLEYPIVFFINSKARFLIGK